MHKSKMYACFAFFPDGQVKRWKYVTDLGSFSRFLTKDHPKWKYFNVYEKGTRNFLKRFYPGNAVPKALGLLLLLLTQKFTFGKTFGELSKSYENTFDKTTLDETTLSETTLSETTFTNGIYNPATIRTLARLKSEVLC